jgi:phosphoserine phosphatase RsbU/P
MAKVVLLQQGAATPFELTDAETVFGRHPDCSIQLQSNMVSRRHARIYQHDGRYLLEDLKSGNGTFLNGKQIAEAVPLAHGDKFKFGPLLLRFESDNPDDQAAANQPTMLGDKTEVAFRIDEGEGGSTIMGSIDNAAGFGMLDVQPQAKLKAVLDISRNLAGTVELEKLLPKLLDSLFEIFPAADRGCILLKSDKTGEMVPRAIKHRRADSDETVKLSRTILNAVLQQKKAILSADAASDTRFEASESIANMTIRSMMCAPMLSLSGEPMGVINIDTQNPLAQFRKDDLDIMVAVAGQAALSYESARLFSSFLEKQKQDNEMQIAAGVQLALLPETMPELEGYEFFASYEAAQAVGGDYYDIFPLKSGKVCLAFGDVAGKGVPASLVMSRMSSVVRSTFNHMDDAAAAVCEINNHMCDKSVEGRFVTFVATLLDPRTHTVQFVNAGHMSPMIRHVDGTVEELEDDATGVPIGVMEDFPYEQVERTLRPGDTVVIYTDGVSEAMNFKGELYGLERLRKFICESPPAASELGPLIREDVRGHADGRPQNDDITLMVFGRTA